MPLCLFPSTSRFPSTELYPFCVPLIAAALDIIVDSSPIELLVDESAKDITLE